MPISGNAQLRTASSDGNMSESEIFYEPEQQPYYLHGGNEGFKKDLYAILLKTAPVTKDCVTGRAFVSFNISEDGQIDSTSIKVNRNKSVSDDYLKAVIEAIKKLGKFEPGKMNGTPKKVTYNLPIIYPIPADFIKTSE